jgi:hypothetical protein
MNKERIGIIILICVPYGIPCLPDRQALGIICEAKRETKWSPELFASGESSDPKGRRVCLIPRPRNEALLFSGTVFAI